MESQEAMRKQRPERANNPERGWWADMHVSNRPACINSCDGSANIHVLHVLVLDSSGHPYLHFGTVLIAGLQEVYHPELHQKDPRWRKHQRETDQHFALHHTVPRTDGYLGQNCWGNIYQLSICYDRRGQLDSASNPSKRYNGFDDALRNGGDRSLDSNWSHLHLCCEFLQENM